MSHMRREVVRIGCGETHPEFVRVCFYDRSPDLLGPKLPKNRCRCAVYVWIWIVARQRTRTLVQSLPDRDPLEPRCKLVCCASAFKIWGGGNEDSRCRRQRQRERETIGVRFQLRINPISQIRGHSIDRFLLLRSSQCHSQHTLTNRKSACTFCLSLSRKAWCLLVWKNRPIIQPRTKAERPIRAAFFAVHSFSFSFLPKFRAREQFWTYCPRGKDKKKTTKREGSRGIK